MARPKHKTYQMLAADPGESTGVALVSVNAEFTPETATQDTFQVLDQDVLSVSDVFRELPMWVKRSQVVVYEIWRLYPTHAMEMIGNEMVSSQVVGMLRYEATRQRRKIISNGAEVKKVALARMPHWLRAHMAKSSQQHDQDAIMHAWFAAMERYYTQEAAQ